MYSLKINNNKFPIKIKIFRNIIQYYEDKLPQSELTKININTNNKIEIISNNIILKEYQLSPIIENYKELLSSMKNNDMYCNVDIYEELIPFKYIIKKVENNLYYESFAFLFRNSIEK